MIDTIALRFPYAVEDEFLLDWIKTVKVFPNGGYFLCYNRQITLVNGAPVNYTYYPNGFTRGPLLIVEFSLPHVIHGSNLRLLQGLERSIDLANVAINSSNFLPHLDLWLGTLIRLDVFFNHKVGWLIPFYLRALGSLQYPHRKTKPYLHEGVMFWSKGASAKFYDKGKESKLPEAQGILRQEATLRAMAIKKITGKKKPGFHDLNSETIYRVLEDDLAKLRLFGVSIGSYDSALKKLCIHYGSFAGLFYYGVLHAHRLFGSKNLVASVTNYSKRSIERYLRDILDVGIGTTLTDAEIPLDPLVIDHSWWPGDDSDEMSQSV